MSRLIDADKLTEIAQEAYDRWNLAMAGAETNREINAVFKMQELFKAVMYVGGRCPTVEERKTGQWEEFEFDYGNGSYVGYNCSECRSPHFEIRNYCPNCGAKMEAGNDGK